MPRRAHDPHAKNNAFAAEEQPRRRTSIFAKDFSAFAEDLLEECEGILEDDALREKLLAEFVGTFFLVLTIGLTAPSGALLTPLAIGGTLAVQIYTFVSVSGGMFNPAVVLAVLLSGREKIKPSFALLAVAAQLLAGVVAGFIARAMSDSDGFCLDWANTPAGGPGTSLVLEVVFTMALCSTVLSTGTSLDAPNQYFGAAIGATVACSAIACGKYHQGGFNPAVGLGINLSSFAGNAHPSAGAFVLWLLVPFLGSVLAAGIFKGTRQREFARELSLKQRCEKPVQLHERLVAEFVGTFMLVLTVGLVATSHAVLGPAAAGGMLAVQIYTFGSVSGGMFNPAVALSVFLSRRDKISAKDASLCAVVQLLAGLIAGLVAWACTDGSGAFSSKRWGAEVLSEVFYTCMLCGIVLAAGTSFDAPNQYFGLAIGTAVAVAGTVGPGCLNPAVALGTIVAGHTDEPKHGPPAASWLILHICPLVGGALAAVIFRLTRGQDYGEPPAPKAPAAPKEEAPEAAPAAADAA